MGPSGAGTPVSKQRKDNIIMTFASQAIADTITSKGLTGTVRGQQATVDAVAAGVQEHLTEALNTATAAAVTRWGVNETEVRQLLIEAGLMEAPALPPADGAAAPAADLGQIVATLNQLVDVANQRTGTRIQRIG